MRKLLALYERRDPKEGFSVFLKAGAMGYCVGHITPREDHDGWTATVFNSKSNEEVYLGDFRDVLEAATRMREYDQGLGKNVK